MNKLSKGKLKYELDWEFLTDLAKRMEKGKENYVPYSWEDPIDIEEFRQALFRHVIAIMKGDYYDDGQELGHIYGATANLMILNYHLKNTFINKALKEFNLNEFVKEYSNDQVLWGKD